MPKAFFKILIKSFEHSTLQLAKEEIEKLCCVFKETASTSLAATSGLGGQDMEVLGCSLKSTSAQLPESALNTAKKERRYCSVTLPSSRRKFTLLRSPHIDKKSREQFQLQTYKAEIEIPFYTKEAACLLLFLLKNSELAGVEAKLVVNCSTPLC
jgi:ribosomal protein S10